MRLEEIEYIIKQNGEVEVKVKGVKGSKCMDITAEIQLKLGETIESEKTSEYYEEPQKETIATYSN